MPRDAVAEAAVDSWDVAPLPVDGAPERVFEHRIEADHRGWCSVAVVNRDLGLRLEVAWDARTLPRLHQWLHPATGVSVLGIEPANCSVLGRASDRAAGTLPMLSPGAARTTTMTLRATVVRVTTG